jgi:hypothetical protein
MAIGNGGILWDIVLVAAADAMQAIVNVSDDLKEERLS